MRELESRSKKRGFLSRSKPKPKQPKPEPEPEPEPEPKQPEPELKDYTITTNTEPKSYKEKLEQQKKAINEIKRKYQIEHPEINKKYVMLNRITKNLINNNLEKDKEIARDKAKELYSKNITSLKDILKYYLNNKDKPEATDNATDNKTKDNTTN
jgi:hypothetical protein